MKFHLNAGAGNVFTGYGDDYVRLGVVEYRENVVVTPERILTGWCPAGFTAVIGGGWLILPSRGRKS